MNARVAREEIDRIKAYVVMLEKDKLKIETQIERAKETLRQLEHALIEIP